MEKVASIILGLCVLCAFTVDGTPAGGRLVIHKPSVSMYESRCVLQGGVCRYVSDCPAGQLTSTTGLCPLQQDIGVECCYTRPRRTSLIGKPIQEYNE